MLYKIEWLFVPFNEDSVKIFRVEIFHYNQVFCEDCKWMTIGCKRGGTYAYFK
jgi:hypothetical protein